MTEEVSKKRCKDMCLSNDECQFWQLMEETGCWIETEIGTSSSVYPLTTAANILNGGRIVDGGLIQHSCHSQMGATCPTSIASDLVKKAGTAAAAAAGSGASSGSGASGSGASGSGASGSGSGDSGSGGSSESSDSSTSSGSESSGSTWPWWAWLLLLLLLCICIPVVAALLFGLGMCDKAKKKKKGEENETC